MNWDRTNLGEFAPFAYGKSLPKEKRIPGAVSVYGSNGVVGSHDVAFVHGPSVIIGRKGSVGEVHLSERPSWPIDTAFYAQGSGNADLYFLYYLLKTLPITSNSDSAVPGLNRDFAHSLEFMAPPLATQKAIGLVLRLLDEKISVNNALSKTLEDIAQTMFKSWFIGFDPVKAKMAGEKPVGMDAETAALFPDSMEESELGEIPAGWQVGAFERFAQIISGGTPKTSEPSYWEGSIPWFSVTDSPKEGSVFLMKTAKIISIEGLEHSAANLVRPGVTIISARGTVGKLAMVSTPSTFNQSCFGVEGRWGDAFNYLLVKSQISSLQGLSHGGMFDTITRETFKSLFFPFAGEGIYRAFNRAGGPMFDLIKTLQLENQTLLQVRDLLLPRLVSGELQIPEEMLAS